MPSMLFSEAIKKGLDQVGGILSQGHINLSIVCITVEWDVVFYQEPGAQRE